MYLHDTLTAFVTFWKFISLRLINLISLLPGWKYCRQWWRWFSVPRLQASLCIQISGACLACAQLYPRATLLDWLWNRQLWEDFHRDDASEHSSRLTLALAISPQRCRFQLLRVCHWFSMSTGFANEPNSQVQSLVIGATYLFVSLFANLNWRRHSLFVRAKPHTQSNYSIVHFWYTTGSFSRHFSQVHSTIHLELNLIYLIIFDSIFYWLSYCM